MSLRYPNNPQFHAFRMRTPDFRAWQESWVHDPSLLEWEGKYYAYSTDTLGAPQGYQIRESSDLVHWKYVGTAFDMDGAAEKYRAGNGEFQAAYDWCVTDESEVSGVVNTQRSGKMSFWAPHCVRGTDGKFWLYFCLTGYFGGSKSCIGLAKSDSPTGGFLFVGLLLQSPAGWRTPNAIDPQFFAAEGRSFLIYGSYGLGLHIIELDPATGLRKDGRTYADFAGKKCTFREYYGRSVAKGSVEGGVVRFHKGVDVLENGTWKKKNYYYLMCSFGSLSSVYNMRCGRSETPEGPYLDVNGNELVCSTDIGTGNKLLGSFRWEDAPFDTFCPGHNDMFVTSGRVNLISYHARTHYFIERGLSDSTNFHYLFLGQYAFNSDGWPVMNSNRYAREEMQEITPKELLQISEGKFEIVLFGQEFDTVKAKRVILCKDETLNGAYSGSWRMYGKNYISIKIRGDEYLGVVMPAWLENQGVAGLTITALGRTSGMALHMNSNNESGKG